MKTKNFVKTNASTAFAQKLAKDALAKEEEKIQKTLREILYERPDDSIVFRIAKNIYENEYKKINSLNKRIGINNHDFSFHFIDVIKNKSCKCNKDL
ncbi:hypothetical protein SAMN02983004_01079 [Borreliella japonica]|uniref:Uncharacterized protein n=1 Tax=Borreliella japonica TaxID=34095 RepID=A0A1G4QEH6_BORJA|nr:hypothetical protein [Borreliella japonica]SCW42867.1 hypothetical protein SAMN02983004_01079 [Borreliella japonica]